jgi:hypothetical protein
VFYVIFLRNKLSFNAASPSTSKAATNILTLIGIIKIHVQKVPMQHKLKIHFMQWTGDTILGTFTK